MLFEKVKEIIVQESGVDESVVTLKSAFGDDLGLDSIILLGIVQGIEDEFGLERVEDEVLAKFVTVENVVEYIKRCKR